MLRLSNQQLGFMRLLLRSPDLGDGWRSVSPQQVALLDDCVGDNPELYEVERDNCVRVRLSADGRVLARYL